MAFTWLLILALQFIDHLAWPLVALGYPICASVQAIETDSYEETRNLISYWILFSLIYLFEYAFLRLLQLFQFWPHIKLMIVFWLIIPDFGRASFVYTYVIRSCFAIKPQALISRLINWMKFFVNKENFLLDAERYIDENGTEALEKLIASKNMSKLDAEATDNKKMQETNGKRLQEEHEDMKDLEVTTKATYNKEMRETIGKGLQIEHKDDIKELEVVAKKGIPAGKQDIPLEPNLAPPNQNISSALVETKAIARKDTAFEQHPKRSSSTDKEVKNEWTCLLCQVTTTSEITWNSHLGGKKHRARSEALRRTNQTTEHKTINQPN